MPGFGPAFFFGLAVFDGVAFDGTGFSFAETCVGAVPAFGFASPVARFELDFLASWLWPLMKIVVVVRMQTKAFCCLLSNARRQTSIKNHHRRRIAAARLRAFHVFVVENSVARNAASAGAGQTPLKPLIVVNRLAGSSGARLTPASEHHGCAAARFASRTAPTNSNCAFALRSQPVPNRNRGSASLREIK